MEFKLTNEQVTIVQLYFSAVEFRRRIMEEFEQWKQEILDSGTYHFDDRCYTGELRAWGYKFPENKILTHRKDLVYISGAQLKDKPGYETTDACRFDVELKKKAVAAGYKHGENALIMADSEWLHLAYQLIDVIYDLHKTNPAEEVLLDAKEVKKTKFDLFPIVTQMESYEPLRRQFYNERMLQQPQAFPG